jgi:methyl-accepting chemotaxis protein
MFDFSDSSFVNYFESDGLQGNEFRHHVYYKNSEGRMFFGGQNGFNAFYPEEIVANPFVPQIAFTNLKVLNKPVSVGQEINNDVILPKSINDIDEIVFSHKNNVFSIEYAVLHYAQPLKNKYAYYLEGFEDDWIYVENQRSATYTNLNPGRYVFRVKGSNNNGLWNESGKSLKIKIRPPWWGAWWFRILVLGLIVMAFYYAIRRRIESVKHEKIVLQEKIAEGEKEVQKQKDEVEKHKLEILEKEKASMESNWFNQSMTLISDIISKNSSDLNDLASNLISELGKLLEVEIGAFFILNSDNQDQLVFQMIGAYNVDENRMDETYPANEGYLGTCYKEKRSVIIDNLPQNYIKLTSGLGEMSMTYLFLIPLVLKDEIKGVIEFAASKNLQEYKINLIDKVAENVAASIEIVQMNKRMEQVIKKLNSHSEELKSQKEEMMQNMEEMAATQEESEKIKMIAEEKETELLEKIQEYRKMESEYEKLKKKYNKLIEQK